MLTELRTSAATGTTVIDAVADLLAPLRVAVSVNVTSPVAGPAVKVVEDPMEGLTVPRALLRVQAYDSPEGHGSDEHVAAALKGRVASVRTYPYCGVTATLSRTDCGVAVIVMSTGGLSTCLPFNEPLAKITNVPAVVPAVNLTGFPAEESKLPMPALFMDHEYTAPDGQVAEQVGVAVRVTLPLAASVAEEGSTFTDMSEGMEMGPMSMIAGELRTEMPFKVAFTTSEVSPAAMPAVKVTAGPEVAFRDPRELFNVQR
jgi:hypothetical protein